MAAANNPFYVAPPDVLRALQEYDNSYKVANDAFQQAQRDALLKEVGQQIQTTGKIDQNVLGRLMSGGMGTLPAVNSVGTILNNEQSRALQARGLTEQERSHRVNEGLHGQEVKLKRDALDQGKITRQYVPPGPLGEEGYGVELGPNGVRRIPLSGTPAPPNQNLTSGTETGVYYGPEVTNNGVRPAPQLAQAGTPPTPVASGAEALMKKYGGNPNDGKNWAYLASLPEKAQEVVVRLSRHDLNPASFPARTMQGQGESSRSAFLTATAKFDPTYNQQDYPIIQNVRNEFAKGLRSRTVTAFNVAFDHLDTLQKYAEAMQNGDYRIINAVRNKWLEETGSDLPTNFKALQPLVTGEIAKAVIGSNNALQDREELRAPLSAANSWAQFSGAIGGYKKLIGGQMKGQKQTFVSQAKRPAAEFDQMLVPSVREYLNAEERGGSSNTTKTGVKWSIE